MKANRSRDKSIPHGTAGGYTNYNCNCKRCKDAFAATSLIARARRRKRGLPPGDPRHGTQNGYGNWGCRCEACTIAHNDYKRSPRSVAL